MKPYERNLYDPFEEIRMAPPRSVAEIEFELHELRKQYKDTDRVKIDSPIGRLLISLRKEMQAAKEKAQMLAIHISHD